MYSVYYYVTAILTKRRLCAVMPALAVFFVFHLFR
jgi:hypothetical protein